MVTPRIGHPDPNRRNILQPPSSTSRRVTKFPVTTWDDEMPPPTETSPTTEATISNETSASPDEPQIVLRPQPGPQTSFLRPEPTSPSTAARPVVANVSPLTRQFPRPTVGKRWAH